MTLSLVLAGSACISWDSGWGDIPGPAGEDEVAPLLARAGQWARQADSAERLEVVVATYEAALRREPDNLEALSNLAMYRTLLGAGYREGADDKGEQYRAAIRYAERIMYRNPEFRRRVEQGQDVWDAAAVLTAAEADGMGWWTTAMFYYFKECVPGVLKIFNNRWIGRNKQIMDRLDTVAPKWHGGANYFNYGIYYLALPESVGGDMTRSARYLERARTLRPDRLLVPWGRAKYYHYKRGDRRGFERDLRWVLARDVRSPTVDPYPWNVYFQREARQLLRDADRLF